MFIEKEEELTGDFVNGTSITGPGEKEGYSRR
jgi:hypothetical protein